MDFLISLTPSDRRRSNSRKNQSRASFTRSTVNGVCQLGLARLCSVKLSQQRIAYLPVLVCSS